MDIEILEWFDGGYIVLWLNASKDQVEEMKALVIVSLIASGYRPEETEVHKGFYGYFFEVVSKNIEKDIRNDLKKSIDLFLRVRRAIQ